MFGPHEDIAAIRLLASRGGALCTLVGIEGSYSRGIGSHLAIADAHDIRGTLADGCLESELVLQAKQAGDEGKPRLVRYGAGSQFIDFRMPCGAGIEILVEPRFSSSAANGALVTLAGRRPASLSLGPGWVRRFTPELRMLVCGASVESSALAETASGLGIEVDLRTPGDRIALGQVPETLDADAFTAIVSLFHDHEWERTLLPWALATDAFYIGAIGGAQTHSRRLDMLCEQGFDEQRRARVRCPIGLIPVAKDPGTLAISILAEVLSEYRSLLEAAGDTLIREGELPLVPDSFLQLISKTGR